jgi:hypothetical protein
VSARMMLKWILYTNKTWREVVLVGCGMVQSQAGVNAVVNLRVPKVVRNFFITRASVP